MLLACDYFARIARLHIAHHAVADPTVLLIRVLGWTIATGLLALLFALIYYWAPDVKHRQWRWLTPGGAIGIGDGLHGAIEVDGGHSVTRPAS